MGRFLQVPPLACVPAPTALLEPQPRAATKGNCSEAEWLEWWHLGSSKPPTPPAQFLPQSRGGGGTKTGPGLLEAANKHRERTRVQTHTRRCANCPAAAEAARRGVQHVSGISFITATAEPPLCASDASSKGPRGPGHSWRKSSPRRVISYSQRRHLGYFKPTLLSPLRKVTELVFYPLIRRCRQNLLPTQLS